MTEQAGGVDSPFDAGMGTTVELAGPERVVATLPVTPRLHQPGGIVHGGAYCALVELAASVGANLWVDGGRVAVGVSNHTHFLCPVSTGTLRAEGTPLQRGRSLQLWEVRITDQHDRLVAHGTVRLAHVDAARTADQTKDAPAPS